VIQVNLLTMTDWQPRVLSDFGALKALARTAQFGEEYIALLNRWHREPAPGRRHSSVLFHASPTSDPTEAS
jgi:hypothetical protein